MDLNLLSLFIQVAESASFSAAAHKLKVPRSSVSRGVAALERSLGVQLFSRTTRSVALTTAGSALFAKVASHLASLRDAVGNLPEREEEPSGLLRISAPSDLGAMVLPSIVSGFSLRYPRVDIEVLLSNQPQDLVAEGFDLAVRIAGSGRLRDSSLVARKVSDLDLQLFAAPTYLARAGTPRSVDELAAQDWVTFRGLPFPKRLPEPSRPARLTCDDVFFVYQALKTGAGIGILPSYLAQEDVERGTLVRVLPRVTLGGGAVFLVHPPGQHIPRKVSAFSQFFIEHVTRHPLVPR